jgi:hypothetical protein
MDAIVPKSMAFPGRVVRARSADSRLTQIAIMAIPSMMFLEMPIGGRIFAPELVLLCLLPGLLLKRGRLLLARLPKTLLVLGILWLGSQILTDVFRSTPFEDWSRGWAKISLFLLDFSALYLLIRGSRSRMLLFLAGIAAGQILAYFLVTSAYALAYPWKFGYGPPVTMVIVILACAGAIRRYFLLQSGLLLLIGVANLVLGSRGAFLICALAAAYVLMSGWRSRQMPVGLSRSKGLWRVVVALLLVGYVSAAGYAYAAEQGWLGTASVTKYESQSAGKYGVFVGGRADVLVSGQAIADSPVIGHGSWAKDWKYQNLLSARLAELGYPDQGAPSEAQGLIPSHSYVLGAWIEGGVLGALFWGWITLTTVRAMRRTYGLNEPLAPMVAFVTLTLLWSVLFSPFGAQERLYAAFFIVVILAFAGLGPRRSAHRDAWETEWT